MGPDAQIKRREWRWVVLLQVLFFVIALHGLDDPFVSTHFVRQNQTFDVSRHVFREGWSAVIVPKASFSQQIRPDDTFSPLSVPSPEYTIIHLEFPFHGLFGWPLAMIFKDHDRVIVRLISVLFGMISIGFVYAVLRQWHAPYPALVGAALWATAPLTLCLGQVPTPDILSTTGMIASFFFALRGRLVFSSGAFLFTLLAKMSVIMYGLPILFALLLARKCRSLPSFFALSLKWGWTPLLGLITWISMSMHDPYGSWVVVGGYLPGEYGHPKLSDFFHPFFYVVPVMSIFPFGCGLIGVLGLWLARENNSAWMSPWLKAAIIIALVVNYCMEKVVWLEPQYTLPILFWVVLAASFGLSPLLEKFRQEPRWRAALGVALVIHLLIVFAATTFFKASRVPNLAAIQAAAIQMPADARVVVYAHTPRPSPPVWLDRNTLKLTILDSPEPGQMDALGAQMESFRKAGFSYLLVFDVEERHSMNPLVHFQSVYLTDYTAHSSPVRQFFDGKFKEVFEGDHVVLYALGD